MNTDHIQGLPIEFDHDRGYDQRSKNWKWYWSMWSYRNLIGQSTDPQDDEKSCLRQILSVVNLIRDQDNIPVTNRSTKAVQIIQRPSWVMQPPDCALFFPSAIASGEFIATAIASVCALISGETLSSGIDPYHFVLPQSQRSIWCGCPKTPLTTLFYHPDNRILL